MSLNDVPRAGVVARPTPLEGPFPVGDTGVRLWVKRDDLTGLGGGGNKVRKLDFLCGEARAQRACTLVTVGAAQSNHCRMTAAAGARLGLDVHLVLSGDRPPALSGNVLLDELFGAQLHFTGAPASHWGELEIAREALIAELSADGAEPFGIPIGGSTAVGALGYVDAAFELAAQCQALGVRPAAVVCTTSSGGTHAGLLAGQAALRADGGAEAAGAAVPGAELIAAADVVGIGVAQGVIAGYPDVAELGTAALRLIRSSAIVDPAAVEVSGEYLGDDYAVPTDAGDAAILWGARHGGLLLDRTYSGKGLAGVLGMADQGRWAHGSDVVFIHTGGWPALFADGGAPGGQ